MLKCTLNLDIFPSKFVLTLEIIFKLGQNFNVSPLD